MNIMSTEAVIQRHSEHYMKRNSVDFIQSGSYYFDTLEKLILSARYEVHIQTYIFASDTTGKKIADALIKVARQGVRVYILADAYGSQNLSSALIKSLTDEGINFRKYGVLYSHGTFHIGRRLHHKVTMIDGHTSIVGGINISDNYNKINNQSPWLDFAIIIRGEINRKLLLICRKRWMGFARSRRRIDRVNLPEQTPSTEQTYMRIRRNDFARNKHEIAISYRQGIRNAQKNIVIVGGYFLPGGRSRRLLRAAVRRGVDIRLLIAEKSDVKILVYARRYLYKWMIGNGIQLYVYNPANVHGKVIVVDHEWTSIGSYDLNNLSTYSNIELNIDIKNNGFSQKVTTVIQKIMEKQSTLMTIEEVKKTDGIGMNIITWIAYRIVKTFFVLSFILAGRKEKEF